MSLSVWCNLFCSYWKGGIVKLLLIKINAQMHLGMAVCFMYGDLRHLLEHISSSTALTPSYFSPFSCWYIFSIFPYLGLTQHCMVAIWYFWFRKSFHLNPCFSFQREGGNSVSIVYFEGKHYHICQHSI